jgi:hypothetical protein
MCNVKAPINMSSVKAIILVGDILEVISFLHHYTRSLTKRQGLMKENQTKNQNW